jgi:lysophospholipase L1-like esterase
MKRISSLVFSIVATLAFLTATESYAQNTNVVAQGSAIVPALRTNQTNWLARHEGFVAQAKQGGVDILFLGDSITDNWRKKGSNVWNKFYAPRRAANFGIGGDRTQHVLWRIDHGELDGLKPKVTVLMIGTNNSNSDSSDPIADAIKLIIREIRAKCPDTKVLLLGIFPRNKPTDKPGQMGIIHGVNDIIARLDDGKTVRYLDIGPKFLAADGKVPADIMPDFLHPNEKGYQIWADAMESTLAAMMK